jgi:hypothetical protein
VRLAFRLRLALRGLARRLRARLLCRYGYHGPEDKHGRCLDCGGKP